MNISRPGSEQTERQLYIYLALVALLILSLILVHHLIYSFDIFPESWNLGLRQPVEDFQRWVVGNRKSHPMFLFFFEPLSAAIDFTLRRMEDFLLWLPWPVVAAAVFLLGQKIADLRLALLSTFCLLSMGWLGLWDQSMQTLALMVISVIISLLIGIPLGIWAARNDRVDTFLRPILDTMQTMPTFVYLIPVLLFFGVARVPSIVATVIYAIPPAVRLTNLGIRQVSEEALEAARAFGSTSRQLLYKVQVPMAMPTIMAGVNQTIMMALSMVVIAALIGAGGLGEVVLVALRGLRVGQALEGGLAIVFMAILLDRVSYALGQIRYSSTQRFQGFRLLPASAAGLALAQAIEKRIDRIYGMGDRLTQSVANRVANLPLWSAQRAAGEYAYLVTSLIFLILLMLLMFVTDASEFPRSWYFSLREPVDAAVEWMRVNLYEIGDTGLGTGPFSDFVTLHLLNPLRTFLVSWLPWPVIILASVALAYYVSGRGLAVVSLLGLALIGWLGMWELAMDTLSQVILSVVIAVLIAVPLGVWSSQNDSVERALRPVLDFIQTIPPFVYLVPVIMLFNLGRVPGIMASILYALPPAVRLTNLGIRQVDLATVEAARSFGSTLWQTLFHVQLPLALPSIMAGINQTIMMILAMVVIAGLVGGGGLGYEVVAGLAQNEMGRGLEAGIAIVLLAVILDRITQAWAKKQEIATQAGG
jgi:glycine betaine/proline transport system permease protein